MNALKQIAFRAFAFLITLSAAHTSFAQVWTQTGGPTGGQIRCVAYSGSTVYVGTYRHGIFRSSDNGATWSPIKLNGTTFDTTVYSIATSGNTVLAGTEGGLAIVSMDNGATWSAIPTLDENSHSIHAVAIHGSTFIAAADQDNILVSTNGGAKWNRSNNGILSGGVTALAVSGNTIWAGVQHFDDTALRMSTNEGQSWTKVPTAGLTAQVNVLAVVGAILVAGTDAGVYFSTDNGAHWASNTNGMDAMNVVSLASDGATAIFAGTLDITGVGGGVYSYSVLSGLAGAWTPVKTGMTGFGSDKIYSLAYAGSSLFAATDNGLYTSADKGSHWTASNKGLSAFTVTALRASGNLLVAGTDNFDVHISSDNGASWTHTSDGLVDLIGGTRSNVYDVAISGSEIFAATDSGVYATSDNGAHWTLGNNMLRDTAVLALYSNGTVLLAGTYSGISVSTNNAATFAPASIGFSKHGVSALTANGATVYAGSNEGGVFSATAGLTPTWTQIKTGMESAASTAVSALVVSGSNVFAGTHGNGVFVTSDGTSWTQITALPNFLNVVALTTNADTLFVATQGQGMFRVAPSGSSWSAAPFGLTDVTIRSLASVNNTVYAGTSDYGVMSSPADLKPIAGVAQNGQFDASIESIAPNPTRGPLAFAFSLANAGVVSVSLFDITGNETPIIAGQTFGEGSHEVTFDASRLPSGIYLCRMSVNGHSTTRNVVIGR